MRGSAGKLTLIIALVLGLACTGLDPVARAGGRGKQHQLLKGLRSKRLKVRLQAVIQIGKQKVKGAIPALRRVADRAGERDVVRAAALVSLAQTGDEASRSRFGYLLGHKTAVIAHAAEQALILLDGAQAQPPVYLIEVEAPRLPKGTARVLAKPILETVQTRLAGTGGVVPGGGENKFLSDEAFEAHLARRKLMGLLLRPEIVTLKEEVSGGRTTILAEVRMSQFTLPGKREEFVALGGADAWIDAARITGPERTELQDETLRQATDSALMQVLQDLVARGAE